ncbi:hypothetical protein BHE74_00012795, partial [Ensete ventricosum]
SRFASAARQTPDHLRFPAAMSAATLPATGGRELSNPPSDGISNLRFSNHSDLLLVSSWDRVWFGLLSLWSPAVGLTDTLVLRVFVFTMPGRTLSRGSSRMLALSSIAASMMIHRASAPVPTIWSEGVQGMFSGCIMFLLLLLW